MCPAYMNKNKTTILEYWIGGWGKEGASSCYKFTMQNFSINISMVNLNCSFANFFACLMYGQTCTVNSAIYMCNTHERCFLRKSIISDFIEGHFSSLKTGQYGSILNVHSINLHSTIETQQKLWNNTSIVTYISNF